MTDEKQTPPPLDELTDDQTFAIAGDLAGWYDRFDKLCTVDERGAMLYHGAPATGATLGAYVAKMASEAKYTPIMLVYLGLSLSHLNESLDAANRASGIAGVSMLTIDELIAGVLKIAEDTGNA